MDSAPPITLKAGSHTVRVEDRFLGFLINLMEGQTGTVMLEW
jgi:hypothetical protein